MYEYIEFSAKNIDDAITKACEHFLVPLAKIDYQVIDKGSNGLFGIGAKNARIKAREISDEEIEAAEKEAKKEKEKKEAEIREAQKKAEEEKKSKADSDSHKQSVTIDAYNKAEDNKLSENEDVQNNNSAVETADSSEEYNSFDRSSYTERGERRRDRRSHGREKSDRKHYSSKKSTAVFVDIDDKNGIKQFLNEMFNAMNMVVDVRLRYAQEDRILDIDLSGDDMGVLIGKRGQTLDAIQYIVSLVINKGHEDYIHVKVDTENYRKRRRDTLENLARNIAFKVKRSHRSLSLEPMNPYERRIIHSSLQNDRYVTTYSEGSEPYRHVVVAPKGSKHEYNK